jgi:hypothetical protein
LPIDDCRLPIGSGAILDPAFAIHNRQSSIGSSLPAVPLLFGHLREGSVGSIFQFFRRNILDVREERPRVSKGVNNLQLLAPLQPRLDVRPLLRL